MGFLCCFIQGLCLLMLSANVLLQFNMSLIRLSRYSAGLNVGKIVIVMLHVYTFHIKQRSVLILGRFICHLQPAVASIGIEHSAEVGKDNLFVHSTHIIGFVLFLVYMTQFPPANGTFYLDSLELILYST